MRSAECAVLGNFTDEVTLLGVAGQITLGILDLDLPCDIRDIIADVKNLAETDRVRWNLIGMLAFDLIGLIPVIGALKYSDETAESVASGEKILKEGQTIYESFADMMSPDDAAQYLDFLENGSKDGLTGAELAGLEKADALLVSQKVEYEDVWDLRNAGDVLESGTSSGVTFKSQYEIPTDEKGYTKSSLDLGKKVHKEYMSDVADDVNKIKEYVLPSGKRVDFIDFENKIVYELKPNNPNQIRKGTKQLAGYLEEIETVYGKGWSSVLDTY